MRFEDSELGSLARVHGKTKPMHAVTIAAEYLTKDIKLVQILTQ